MFKWGGKKLTYAFFPFGTETWRAAASRFLRFLIYVIKTYVRYWIRWMTELRWDWWRDNQSRNSIRRSHWTEHAEKVFPFWVSDQQPPLLIAHRPGPKAVIWKEQVSSTTNNISCILGHDNHRPLILFKTNLNVKFLLHHCFTEWQQVRRQM